LQVEKQHRPGFLQAKTGSGTRFLFSFYPG
jgi:hypothetical protein